MPNVTLLYSATCSACPSAKSLFKELRAKYSFSYREVDITSPDGQELADLLKKYDLGVQTVMVEKVEVDVAWFNTI